MARNVSNRTSRDVKTLKKMNTKPYNKKNSSKRQREIKEMVDTGLHVSESNPYSWYASFPNYAKDVASLAFGLPVGQPLAINAINNVDYVVNAGIMVLYFTPGIGVSNDLTSPINRQAVRTYTYLRSIQRAAANYDSADLMMYMLGVDSLYTYWAYLRRAYGVAQLFTPTNKYYPKRLLQAMGVDPSVCQNLADFRAYINRFALNIGKFAMPADFKLADRHRWMCSGIYLDSSTKKAQTYMFVPSLLWEYDNTVATGSQLVGHQMASFASNPIIRDYTSLIAIGEALLQNFENDEDTMNISGDLYRAYEGRLMQVEETPDNYTILPVYDETVLSQIENSVAIGRWVNDGSPTVVMPKITQDPSINNGAIKFNGATDIGMTPVGQGELFNYALVTPDSFLNMHHDSPDHEAVMEATRLITKISVGTYGSVTTQNTAAVIADAGSDMINYYSIVTTNADNQAAVKFLSFFTNTIWQAEDGVLINTNASELLALIQQFDWGPMLYVVRAIANSTIYNANLLQVAADVDNFTVASRVNLQFIHEAALLSLLDTPTPISK